MIGLKLPLIPACQHEPQCLVNETGLAAKVKQP